MERLEEDFEKIQRREYQRQVFLEELQNIIFNAEEECLAKVSEKNRLKTRIFFHLVISSNFASHLMSDQNFDSLNFIARARENGGSVGSLFEFVSKEIIPKVKAFTTVEAERLFLIACLLEHSALEVKRPFSHKILELSVPPGRDWFLEEIGLNGTIEPKPN